MTVLSHHYIWIEIIKSDFMRKNHCKHITVNINCDYHIYIWKIIAHTLLYLWTLIIRWISSKKFLVDCCGDRYFVKEFLKKSWLQAYKINSKIWTTFFIKHRPWLWSLLSLLLGDYIGNRENSESSMQQWL